MEELTDQQIAEVTDLVTEAGTEALAWFRPQRTSGNGRAAPLVIDNKRDGSGGFDPVTEADRSVEQTIRAALTNLFPDDAITGEEFGTTGSGRRRWFIDPIDGTRAFVSGQPMWGTLVGLVADGDPVAGWMHLPVLNETYVGCGSDAWLYFPGVNSAGRESVKMETTSTARLSEATMLSTDPSMFSPGQQWDRFAALASTVKLLRYSGDCMNYGLVATGDADLVVENQLAPYDIIPLIPIITAAGGVVTDLEGNVPVDGGYVVAAANADLHGAALKFLNA